MKRRAIAAAVIAAVFLVLVVGPVEALAWDDCPKGITYDPYPGVCPRYVDTNDNGICDHSEPEPTDTTSTTSVVEPAPAPETSAAVGSSEDGNGDLSEGESMEEGPRDAILGAAVAGAAASTSTTIPPTGGDGGAGSEESSAISGEVVASSGIDQVVANAVDDGGQGDSGGVFATLTTEYNFGLIAGVMLLVYVTSFVLYKTHKMTITTHRRIWNLLLMVTFLVTGILGTLLTIQLNYGIRFNLPFNMLFWHVEAGVAMTIISVFHIG